MSLESLGFPVDEKTTNDRLMSPPGIETVHERVVSFCASEQFPRRTSGYVVSDCVPTVWPPEVSVAVIVTPRFALLVDRPRA
mgnify:CR=1 FL=1